MGFCKRFRDRFIAYRSKYMMYPLKDALYSIQDLSAMSGIEEHTIRDRLRRGYSVESAIKHELVHESVEEFADASWYGDWIGMSTTYLYEIYWGWCRSHGFTPLSQISFTRQIMKMYPNLKTVPTRRDNGCMRIIRER